MNEYFWNATNEERLHGYVKNIDQFHCIACDYRTEQGFVYPVDDRFMDAEKAIQYHIAKSHGSVFDMYIGQDKQTTGLSDHQRQIMKLFYEGASDYEVQKALNIGSISTIRNHRSLLKEKEKQALMTTTLMTLMNSSINDKGIVAPHKTATMLDDRYATTVEESIKVINKYFPNGTDQPLKSFSMKEKQKIIILREIIKKFDGKQTYTEKEVDHILKEIYASDYALIRRYLIQYGFMDRKRDGSVYWVKEEKVQMTNKKKDLKKMKDKDRKKALKQAYMAEKASEPTISGVYQVKNTENGKIYLSRARDVKKLNGVSFQLNMGTFMNKGLQKDWTELGEDKFEISILESFEEKGTATQISKKLSNLERQWKNKLSPYGDRGYHKKS